MTTIYIITGDHPGRSALARTIARGQARAMSTTTIPTTTAEDPLVFGEVLRTGAPGLIIDALNTLDFHMAEQLGQQFQAGTVLSAKADGNHVLVQTPVLVFSARHLTHPVPSGHPFFVHIGV
jgi:hypothetical protein